MTDADVDGAHIRTLLLTFFFRYARELVEAGALYIAQPPLYLIRQGKGGIYAYNDKELEEKLKELEIYSNSIFKNVINEYETLINENFKT